MVLSHQSCIVTLGLTVTLLMTGLSPAGLSVVSLVSEGRWGIKAANINIKTRDDKTPCQRTYNGFISAATIQELFLTFSVSSDCTVCLNGQGCSGPMSSTPGTATIKNYNIWTITQICHLFYAVMGPQAYIVS